MNKRRCKCVLLILLFVLCSSIKALACDMTEYSLDAGGGWERYAELNHMGQKNTTYAYADDWTKQKYSDCVESGISYWGADISCVESAENAVGTFETVYYANSVYGYAEFEYNSAKHVTGWTIQINSLLFDNSVTNEGLKGLVIAHELGHVYGLAHVNDPTQIMYETATTDKWVMNDDRIGMKVVTHSHTHTKTYTQGSTSHVERCSVCKMYRTVNCQMTDWHSGKLHYYEIDCVCGNYQLTSRACSGSPCISFWGTQPEYETQ